MSWPGIEHIFAYQPGGYHPVHLGDKYNNRYVIEHKLGEGGFSTVWLAHDTQQDRLVSLKIPIACSAPDASDPSEADFLRRLSSLPFFPTLLDEFVIHGPNGSHRCTVTEVLGPSIAIPDPNDRTDSLPLLVPVAKRVAVQLAVAVAELHRLGIIHGDLHPRNILFRIPGIDAWTVSDFRRYLGEPRLLNVDEMREDYPKLPAESSHQPKYLVESPCMSALASRCQEFPEIKIM
jgi:serine/threonine-protein kinase SRPK3